MTIYHSDILQPLLGYSATFVNSLKLKSLKSILVAIQIPLTYEICIYKILTYKEGRQYPKLSTFKGFSVFSR